MALRLGGFTCDKCVKFHRYVGSHHTTEYEIEYNLPLNWNLYNKKYIKIISNNNMFDSNKIVDNILLCDDCSIIYNRKEKINKLIKIYQ